MDTEEGTPAIDAENTYSLGSFYENAPRALTEQDRLEFARHILLCLFLLVLLVFLASYGLVAFDPANAELGKPINAILDITKTVVPSTVTLVLGFYFGGKDSEGYNNSRPSCLRFAMARRRLSLGVVAPR